MPRETERTALFSKAFKVTAGLLSGLGALVTVLTFARQEGVIGPLATVSSPVAFIRLSPVVDTAFAIGDTLHYAAAATDTNGAVLPAPQLTWTTANTEVAVAHTDGSVIAIGAGRTTVVVTAGRTTAQAVVVVNPRVVSMRPATDTVEIPEGESTSLIAMPFDLHGKLIRGLFPRWRSLDTTTFTVDSLGLAAGTTPGLARAEARIDGVSTQLVVKVTPVLGSIAIGSGSEQHALASTGLPAPVVIRSLSRQGHPLGGVRIRAAVDGGRLEVDTITTDDQGLAHFRWILGDKPGPQHFVARSDEIDTTLTLGAEADPTPANTRFALVDSIGTGPAGADLPAPVVVRLTDTLGQVLVDVPVRWLAQDGSRIVGKGARTDSLGLASATWTLGPKVGPNRARIVAGPGSLPSFPLETRSQAGAPAVVAVLDGDRARTQVGRTVSVRVKVTDAERNVVAGQAVTAIVAQGSVTMTDAVTREDGTARIVWTLGPTAGDQTLDLNAATAKATLTATAQPAPASKVELVAPTISIISSNTVRVTALVTDSLGNPIAGNVVQARVATGAVAPLRATTDAQGRANFTWTPARRSGEQTITVHAAGVRTDATKTVRRSGQR